MSEVTVIAAESRAGAGKGAAHAVRRAGKIPAVIYGDKQPPLLISLELKMITRHTETSGLFTRLFDVEVDGSVKHRVLARDIQFDPVSDRPIHADFLRVSPTTRLRVSIPVVFINSEKSPGIKRGGTLNIVHHEILVSCAPTAIPEKFEVDLDGLQIGEAVHLSNIKLPEGVRTVSTEKDFTVASIAVPSAIRSEVEATATPDATAAAATPAAAGAKGAAAAPAKGAAASPAKGAAPASGAKK